MKTSVVSPFVAALLALVIASLSPVSAQTTTAKAKKIPFHGTLQSVDAAAGTVTLESKKEPAGRVFHVQPDTKITDGAGNATTLSAAVKGEDVGGSYTKDASGNMELFSLRLGAKDGSAPKTAAKSAAKASAAPAAETTPAPASTASTAAAAPAPAPASANTTAAETATTSTKAKTQRFSGKVVSVDAGSNTLVVHGKADQTFTVTSATKFSGAANLGAVTAGEKVTGSYQKSTDGATLTVTALKVTK